MGFHKAEFFVAQVNGNYKKVSGWTDESGTYGFHALRRVAKKSGNKRVVKWVVSDIASGLMITSERTRDECLNWVVIHQKEIDKQRKKKEYKEYVEKLNKILDKENL